MTALLDTAGTRDLWDRRHRSEDALRSGGHIGLTSEGNAIFYATRLGRLLDLLGDVDTRESPGLLLDAGCGKGWFARALAGCGWLVDGVDASPAAIEECRAAGGGPRYEVAALADLRRPLLYDAVLCIDVLFHVLADEEWRTSLTRLAALVRLGGRLVVSDAVGAERRQLGAYIVHRPYAEYADVLGPLGLRGPELAPFRFRDSEIAFAAFTRAC